MGSSGYQPPSFDEADAKKPLLADSDKEEHDSGAPQLAHSVADGPVHREPTAHPSSFPQPPMQAVPATDGQQPLQQQQKDTAALQQHSPTPTAHSPVTGVINIPDFPDALAAWQRERPRLVVWLVLSIVTFVFMCTLSTLLSLAGLLGIVGASLVLCGGRDGMNSTGSTVRVVRVLAIVATVISSFIALLLLMVMATLQCGSEEDCQSIRTTGIAVGLWYAVHATVSAYVAHRATQIKQLLDPVSSGVVLLV